MSSRLSRAFIVALLFLTASGAVQAQDSTRLVLSTVGDGIETRIAERALKAAYAELGITVVVERFTGDIGIDRANNGVTDGEVIRVNDADRAYANLREVSIPLGYFDVVVYAKDPALRVHSWQDLRAERVGVVRGVLSVERAIGELKVRMVDTYAELFALFAAGEVDAVVVATMDSRLAQRIVPALSAARSVTTIDTSIAFHYLNKKHEALAPRVEPILKRMLLDGTIARIRGELISQSLGGGR